MLENSFAAGALRREEIEVKKAMKSTMRLLYGAVVVQVALLVFLIYNLFLKR